MFVPLGHFNDNIMKKLLIIPMLFACYLTMGQAYDFNIKKKLNSATALRSVMVSSPYLDGNTYLADADEKLIGEQIWMTSNLNVTKFKNGDTIYEAKTKAQWIKASKDKKPAWCYYQNNAQYEKKYAKLYNWYAVNDPRGLAPKGWHIPSSNEWEELISFIKKDGIESLKTQDGWNQYKTEGTEYVKACIYCNRTGLNRRGGICFICKGAGFEKMYIEGRYFGNGTNSSGFSAIPSAKRLEDGRFNDRIGDSAYWWAASETQSQKGYAKYFLITTGEKSKIDNYSKGNGISVRLVKDNPEKEEKDRIAKEEKKKKYSAIIGKSIQIGNIEVAQYDFPEVMNWDDAKKACEALGQGWKLPSQDELNSLYLSKDKIGGFKHNYWSSTENDFNGLAWYQNFSNGFQFSTNKYATYYVRAIRAF